MVNPIFFSGISINTPIRDPFGSTWPDHCSKADDGPATRPRNVYNIASHAWRGGARWIVSTLGHLRPLLGWGGPTLNPRWGSSVTKPSPTFRHLILHPALNLVALEAVAALSEVKILLLSSCKQDKIRQKSIQGYYKRTIWQIARSIKKFKLTRAGLYNIKCS